jgi:PhnB protein
VIFNLEGRKQMSQAGMKQTPVAGSKAQVNPYLIFNGRCEEAFKFYEQALGGKIETIMTFGDSPMARQAPPDWGNKVVHARMTVGNTVLMGSDAPPDRYRPPQGFSLSVGTKDPADAERMFNELGAGGKVEMPLEKTFWAVKFGMLVDRFGIAWMINCEQPEA